MKSNFVSTQSQICKFENAPAPNIPKYLKFTQPNKKSFFHTLFDIQDFATFLLKAICITSSFEGLISL